MPANLQIAQAAPHKPPQSLFSWECWHLQQALLLVEGLIF